MKNLVEVRKIGSLATVSIDRPERMNAVDLAAWRQLTTVFEAVNEDPDIRCVVLRGAGERSFAAGADITEFSLERSNAAQGALYDATMRRALEAVAACPHPVIAQIYGPCVGAGLELAAQCDLRLSSRSGRFGVPVGRIAVTMTLPELATVQRLIGPARMLEILLEARVFGADEALAMGLVHRVVDDAMLQEEVAATAARIMTNAPLVNRRHKAFVRRAMLETPFTADEETLAYDCLATDDHREGMAAFAEKRAARFTGR
ncbi:enoyl-CoA hydratase-related protein [Telmatospirillum sp.]|uniref:enoyl-CoA hydratase/isomerase family protein n=1 Tax=Telmatospirillum sp. TaxID=2079197 RepID=UPI002850A718|nr:enoyl-CoA hydratase-related protein [Telmatospirillum sp.]MDR3435403.1 enoyl-CoA hydratase-related protein [Telmatospirillum sp.]